MPVASLTRVVTFSATHRYFRPEWTAERNAEVFGATTQEHGHEYRCEVTVRGTPDAQTGMVIDLGALDRILSDEVVQRFDHRRIHVDVPEYAEGRTVPTGEMLCLDIWKRISPRLPAGCSLASVKVQENPLLYAEYRGE